VGSAGQIKTTVRWLYLIVFACALALAGCRDSRYELIERSEKVVPDFSGTGTHTQVGYVLLRDGHKFHATCDFARFRSSDPENTCRLEILHKYNCAIGRDGLSGDPWNMKCLDYEGRNVYLYIDKKE